MSGASGAAALRAQAEAIAAKTVAQRLVIVPAGASKELRAELTAVAAEAGRTLLVPPPPSPGEAALAKALASETIGRVYRDDESAIRANMAAIARGTVIVIDRK